MTRPLAGTEAAAEGATYTINYASAQSVELKLAVYVSAAV
jgi:hypothetical protein